MKTILLLTLVSFGLTACAQMLPARAKELGNGRYMLESSGNIFAKEQTLENIIDKKAKKLCANGYRYETTDASKFHNQTFNYNNQKLPSGYSTMQRIIKCEP